MSNDDIIAWFRNGGECAERGEQCRVMEAASGCNCALAADTITALNARVAELEAALLDGSRPLPIDRETLGRMVREAWVRWALTQPSPKPSWLVPYDALDEPDKEADRQIGESVARFTLIHDAGRAALSQPTPMEKTE
jgi:hypothetical protein